MEPVVPSTTLLDIYGVEGVVYAVGTSGRIFKNVTITGVDPFNEELLPTKIELYQNYPNPFNPETTIKYTLKENYNGIVNISVYDINGKHIQILVNEVQPTGSYNVTFNAGDLASGIYYYRIITKDFKITRKMILIK